MIRLLILSIFLGLQSVSAPAAQDSNPLYEELSRAGEVKVFVALPTDPSEKTGLDLDQFKKALEEELRGRKSIRFSPVASEAESKLVVETQVAGFQFSEHDPIDMLIGAGAAAMDAAKDEHFASLEADFTVREPDGRMRWKDRVRATITDAAITEAESRERILPRVSQGFVKEAFGKKRSK